MGEREVGGVMTGTRGGTAFPKSPENIPVLSVYNPRVVVSEIRIDDELLAFRTLVRHCIKNNMTATVDRMDSDS